MRNKKHIDRVFQEKLKDFEATPSPKVWKNIKTELAQEGQSKKVFPFWWRLAGVAALLLMLFSIGNLIQSGNQGSNNLDTIIVDTEDTNSNSESPLNETNNSILTDDSDETSANDGLTNSVVSESENINANSVVNTLNPEKHQNERISNNSDDAKKVASKNNAVSGAEVVDKAGLNANTRTYKNTSVNSIVNNDGSNTTKAVDMKTMGERSKDNLSDNISNDSGVRGSKDGIATNIANEDPEVKNENPLQEMKLENNKDGSDHGITDSVVMNQSENEENKETTEGGDIIENKEEELLSIEEEIAKAEDIIEKEEEKKVDRWQVYANVAPVYYNTLGKGSHIDNQFVENSKSGEVNMSYGVNVSYAFNEKLKLRTGVSTLDLSYDTDNVILYENVGVNYNGTPRNINWNSAGQSFTAISASNLGAQQLSDLVGGDNNAAISQRIAYYEVPLELEYNLVNSKFGLNVFGGFSTFILEDNQIFSEFDGYKTEVGEANNINSVSFSGNIGLGLDYKFSEKILFNILPTFKYQLNAYKNTSGNFRPYIVGLYTGLSYKF